MMLTVRQFDTVPYEKALSHMQHFTLTRAEDTKDELWFLEHEPVYTQGYAGKEKHILYRNDIPIIQSDRGGQITYHGPGQLILYPLLNLKRLQSTVHQLVALLQQMVIDYLQSLGIEGNLMTNAPGVYVCGEKIASIGLRVKRYCCYHGLSFNLSNQLSAFEAIRPCGLDNMRMTSLVSLGCTPQKDHIIQWMTKYLQQSLGYTKIIQQQHAQIGKLYEYT